MHRGYIKIWRKIEDSGLFQMHSTLALFMYMLMNAAHQPKKVGTQMGVIELERGQLISGRHKLAATLALTEQKTRTCLDNLHNMEIITSKATNKFTIYTIVNYENYQGMNVVSNQQDNQQTTSETTNKQPTNNQQITTYKELKNLRIKEKPLCASPKGECTDDVKNSLYTKSFLAFWELYPNRKNKGDAAKAFAKIKAAEYPDIRKGLEAAIASPDWRKDNGRFIPHPGTWLRARGWEDEGCTTVASSKPFNLDDFYKQVGA